jgi:hypothetical protein
MSNELRTDFTAAERNTVIEGLRDEYGDREFSEELILLECQDLWRKGCHNLENGTECRGCGLHGECGLIDWEKRNPEYKDDALAKRLKELRDEVAGVQRAEITKRLLEKGYVKVQWKQWNDGELTESDVKLYQPGSKDLMAALAEAIENWKNMWGEDFRLGTMNLNAKNGVLLELYVHGSDENEVWEIV